jgi:Icc protein
VRPLRLVQFTDLHLYGAMDGRLRGVEVLATLRATLAAAAADLDRCDAVLLTGDLVQDDPAGYAHVQALFGDSPVPVYCLPGNHDEPGPMRAALAAAPFRLNAVGTHGAWQLVMLDSCLHGEAGGRLAASELRRLDAALAAAPDRHALVCLHHHPVPMASRWLDTVGLDNAPEFFDVLDSHPQVRGVLWGHVHQVFDSERRGVRLLGTPSTCAQFKPRAAGFAVDQRPPAYRWLDLYPDGRIETAVEWVATATPQAVDEAEPARERRASVR